MNILYKVRRFIKGLCLMGRRNGCKIDYGIYKEYDDKRGVSIINKFVDGFL